MTGAAPDSAAAEPSAAASTAITKLTLRRFRSHAAFEQRFAPGVVAIHGPNGTGKTNLLEAIATLSPGRGLRGASADDMAGRPDPIGWSVSAEVALRAASGATETFACRISFELPQRRRSVRLDGDAAPMTELARRIRLIWLTPAMDRLWIEGASGRRRYIDRLTLAFDPAHGERSAQYERAMRERNRLLKEPRPEPAWLDAVETRLAETGLGVLAARRATIRSVLSAQSAAAAEFPLVDLALAGDLEAAFSAEDIAEQDPQAAQASYAARLAGDRRADAVAGRTRLGPHRTELEAWDRRSGAAAAQCSTGEQKALLLSLTLASARAVAAQFGRRPILLLDEVAAHLDPDRRAALFGALTALGAQTFLTGVSEAEFGALDADAQRVGFRR